MAQRELLGFINLLFFQVCLSTSLMNQNNFRAILFGEHVDKHSLHGHVMKTTQVEDERHCQVHCVRTRGCLSYNLGSMIDGKHKCELNSADRYKDPKKLVPKSDYKYRQVKTPCDSAPCGVNETCIPDYENDSHKCNFAAKLNVGPVCFGAKGSQFGSVVSPIETRLVTTFQLVHLSGYVNCVHAVIRNSNWGCKGMTGGDINTAITDAQNKLIAPDTAIPRTTFYGYNLPGYHANSPTLNLNTISVPFKLKKGSEIRVWYTQDLYKYGDGDNHGVACMDVIAIRN